MSSAIMAFRARRWRSTVLRLKAGEQLDYSKVAHTTDRTSVVNSERFFMNLGKTKLLQATVDTLCNVGLDTVVPNLSIPDITTTSNSRAVKSTGTAALGHTTEVEVLEQRRIQMNLMLSANMVQASSVNIIITARRMPRVTKGCVLINGVAYKGMSFAELDAMKGKLGASLASSDLLQIGQTKQKNTEMFFYGGNMGVPNIFTAAQRTMAVATSDMMPVACTTQQPQSHPVISPRPRRPLPPAHRAPLIERFPPPESPRHHFCWKPIYSTPQ